MIDLVERNPHLKKPVAMLLGMTLENAPCDRRVIEGRAAQEWGGSFNVSPESVMDSLVRAGALVQQTMVDGEPYDGTLEDIQFDESIPLDAKAEILVNVTDEGRELARSIDPRFMIDSLLAERPGYRAIFARMVERCASDAGASRMELEDAVEHDGHPASPDGKRVYPQYFIDALETVGAIEWDGAWHATEAGRSALA